MRAAEFLIEKVNPDMAKQDFRAEKDIDIPNVGILKLIAQGMDTDYPHQFTVNVINQEGKKIGHFRFVMMKYSPEKRNIFGFKIANKEDPYVIGGNVSVWNEYQKKGIATEVYRFVKELGNDIRPSTTQSPAGKAMWQSFDRKQTVDESKAQDKSGANVLFLNPNTVIVGQEHGKKLKLSPDDVERIKAIADQHGAWYEGNGMDQELTKGIIDDYQGSWDDDLLSPAIKGYPAPFLYVLFSNIKENDTVKGKIGPDPDSTIFDRILNTQPSTNYFPDRTFDADTLEKFLRAVSEGPYDFVQMSQAPATEQNVAKFFKLGERLMWPKNWEEYPNRAGRVAKSVNDLRDKFLASRKRGVYVVGSDHLIAVQDFLNQRTQDLAENFADGKIKGKSRPGRVKRAGASCKGSVTSLRQKAKQGGERGRMYHWCANMKSGRQK